MVMVPNAWVYSVWYIPYEYPTLNMGKYGEIVSQYSGFDGNAIFSHCDEVFFCGHN